MKHYKIVLMICLAVFFLNQQSRAQLLSATCNTQIITQPSDQRGGRFMPSSGTLNVLFVYVQFPDDNFQPTNAEWPVGQAPVYMNSTIEQTWSATPTPGNFTDYFNQMSLNSLKLTGIAVSVITPHSRQWYLDNSKVSVDIYKEVLQQLDATIDFAQFDHWTLNSDYNITNTPDGTVDMIFMMWRNIASELSNAIDVQNYLHLVPGGEASLGYGNSFTVDNGARTIQMGFWGYGILKQCSHPAITIKLRCVIT